MTNHRMAGFMICSNLAFFFAHHFGLSFWTGQKTYVRYACPSCGKITDKGAKWFIMPNEIRVAIAYIF